MTKAQVLEAHERCKTRTIADVAQDFGVSKYFLKAQFAAEGLKVPKRKNKDCRMGEVRFLVRREIAELVKDKPELKRQMMHRIVKMATDVLYL